MRASGNARVRVPASSANLGAGYDCIGFAVDRWLTASVGAHGSAHAGQPEVRMQRRGTLSAVDVAPADDAIVAGFLAACRWRDRDVPARLDFEMQSDIPVASGLGSSSAALVAGALLANAALDLGLDRDDVAQLCTGIEGHPDNVAPAALGGAILGVPAQDGQWVLSSIPVDERLAFAFVVPPIRVETARARAILPKDVTHATAVRAAGKAAALALGLVMGDADQLAAALDDVLHVPYRKHLIPAYDEVVRAACAAGAHGATLSGSGATILAVSAQEDVDAVARAMQRAFAQHDLRADAFVQRGMVSV